MRNFCSLTGQRQDPCVLDVRGGGQARDARLPAEQCQWWYWSRRRRERTAPMKSSRASLPPTLSC
jgi:hypothetical protein